jgi:hypothetical protein
MHLTMMSSHNERGMHVNKMQTRISLIKIEFRNKMNITIFTWYKQNEYYYFYLI